MDTLKHYQTLIKQALKEYACFLTLPPKPPYEVIVAFDDERHQYLLRKLGWTKKSALGKLSYMLLFTMVRSG